MAETLVTHRWPGWARAVDCATTGRGYGHRDGSGPDILITTAHLLLAIVDVRTTVTTSPVAAALDDAAVPLDLLRAALATALPDLEPCDGGRTTLVPGGESLMVTVGLSDLAAGVLDHAGVLTETAGLPGLEPGVVAGPHTVADGDVLAALLVRTPIGVARAALDRLGVTKALVWSLASRMAVYRQAGHTADSEF